MANDYPPHLEADRELLGEDYPRELEAFQKRLGYSFKKLELLTTALTHSSFVGNTENASPQLHNERMEFLGDSILDFVLSEELYRKQKRVREGILTQKRASLVNTTSLQEKALALGIDQVLILGRGEEKTGGRRKISVLADAFEAVVAAVYLDAGIRKTKQVILHLFSDDLSSGMVMEELLDALSLLYQLAQEKIRIHPRFTFLREEGPQHAPIFHVEVQFHGITVGRGSGRTKKAAKQQGAEDALKTVDEWLPKVLSPGKAASPNAQES